jgi:energy-coupling factor transport system permease protein
VNSYLLSYTGGSSPVHALSGVTKFIVFLLWSVLGMAGYDTRVMLVMCGLGILIFALSSVKFRDIAFILKMLVIFMILNLLGIYLFAPEQGVEIYGSRHILCQGIGRYTLTAEQLFYEFNVFLKYLLIFPAATALILTTSPSEFAASLNRIGVPYTAAYAVSLALRYIPDVQRDYQGISQSQQARGTELSRKAPWSKRLSGTARIILPLIFSSLDRIDVISHAMELRSFGKYRKRTWYSSRPFTRADAVVLILALILFILGVWVSFRDGSRFYNPFLK